MFAAVVADGVKIDRSIRAASFLMAHIFLSNTKKDKEEMARMLVY
jgi:hypothetical protein